ncbi:MAG: type II toxin-antitoxin system ParD family antitoxin [Microbacterium sp.]
MTRTTKQLSITLPTNMAEALKERVTSGAYASESEVVRDGLRALFAREEAVETWLRTEVVASYDELRADPSRAISAADMRAHLAELHARRLAERDS